MIQNKKAAGVVFCRNHGEYYFREGCFIMELWNSPQDDSVSVAQARVAPGKTTRLHRLHGVVERYIVLAGEGSVEIDGQEPRKVEPGDAVFIPQGATQRITNTSGADLVFLAVCTPRFTSRCYEDLDCAASEADQKNLDNP